MRPSKLDMHLLRDASRHLLRRPAASIVAVTILAVAFGAASGMFGIVQALVLNGLPYPHAARLVTVAMGGPSWSPAMLDAFAETNTTLELFAGVAERAATVTGSRRPEVVRLEGVSRPYFDLLGAYPAAGAIWTTDADVEGPAGAVAVISDAFRRRAFGEQAEPVGARLSLDGTPVTVAGISRPRSTASSDARTSGCRCDSPERSGPIPDPYARGRDGSR